MMIRIAYLRHMVQMFKLLAGSISVVLLVAIPVYALEQPVLHSILITELQPESAVSGTEELIRLHNPNEVEIDVTNWQIQYRSALSTDEAKWVTKATLNCDSLDKPDCKVLLPAKGSLLLATYDTGHKAFALTSGMALSGGQVRLVQKTPQQDLTVHDMVGYGSAVVAEGEAAIAPQKGNGIKRLQNEESAFVDTDNNKHDFALSKQSEPEESSSEEPGQGAGNSYLALLITELLPDPASPAEDEKDEFIELYNPHDTEVALKDYVIEAGSNWRYKFVLPDVTLPAHSYMTFHSEETGISLSNSGTSVRLISPASQLLDEVTNYGKAKTGQSWIRLESGEWRWSLEVTPGGANILEVEEPKVLAVSATKPAKVTAKKATTTKAKAAAKPKTSVKAAKTKEQKPVAALPVEQAANISRAPNYWLIGTVAALAGGYALYEYRHDAANRLRRIREVIKGKQQSS